ncbi:MAG: SEC-C metal-binding domain-containing protein, partial [Alphaproteobacteria bacterium]|nr:SEC-C metal-binding domain-containing protein [Alphaproteobacteria bacterium]
MRIFGSDNMANLLRKMGAKEGEVISHAWMNKALARAQQKVEARNFDMRKHLLKYDDVMNDQRKVIYGQRRDIMNSNDISEDVKTLYEDVLNCVIDAHLPPETLPDLWDVKSFHEEIYRLFSLDLPIQKWVEYEGLSQREICMRIEKEFNEHMQAKESTIGAEALRRIERDTLLRILDSEWKNHLLALDHLRQGINLRAYAQGNPLNEYKREAFALFQTMMLKLREEFTATMSHVRVSPQSSLHDIESALLPEIDFSKLSELSSDDFNHAINTGDFNEAVERFKAALQKQAGQQAGNSGSAYIEGSTSSNHQGETAELRRNDPCFCGSGKKYKYCHGAL